MFDEYAGDLVGLFPGEGDDELYELTLVEWEGEERVEGRQWIPEGLDSMIPGPFLAVIVSGLEVSRLTGSDVVTVLRARQRLVSHGESGVYEAMAESAYRVDPDTLDRSATPTEFASEEIAAALSLTRRKADHELGVALDLMVRLPQVMTALAAGVIDGRKAGLLAAGTDVLEVGTARGVVDELLVDAGGLTSGQLRARLRRLCIEADPDDAQKRYERSVSERKMLAEENDEGTAALIISQCSPEDVYAARDHVNMLARRLKTAAEPRNIDQLRADVAIGLLTGSIEGAGERGGSVDIRVDLTTLAGLDDQPGDLGGYGPVVAEVARKVADRQLGGDWSATVTDPETGEPLHTVALRRRPTVAQQRRIRVLYPTCSFKGCRMPAVESDLDHITDHARGGPTTVGNQAPLCRRHHLAKHRGGWRYRKVNKTRFEWTSPLGHTYHTGPPP